MYNSNLVATLLQRGWQFKRPITLIDKANQHTYSLKSDERGRKKNFKAIFARSTID